jgi:hypothetical protein
MALMLLDPRLRPKIAEAQQTSIAQAERGEDLGRLITGWIHQVEPKNLILGQPLKTLGPVVYALALPPIEEIGPHLATVTESQR